MAEKNGFKGGIRGVIRSQKVLESLYILPIPRNEYLAGSTYRILVPRPVKRGILAQNIDFPESIAFEVLIFAKLNELLRSQVPLFQILDDSIVRETSRELQKQGFSYTKLTPHINIIEMLENDRAWGSGNDGENLRCYVYVKPYIRRPLVAACAKLFLTERMKRDLIGTDFGRLTYAPFIIARLSDVFGQTVNSFLIFNPQQARELNSLLAKAGIEFENAGITLNIGKLYREE